MSVRVLREEIVDHGDQEVFEAETWGELYLMPRNAQEVYAIFGHFRRTENSTLLYTCVVVREEDEIDEKCLQIYDSMYLDDLTALREGNVEIYEYR